MVVPLESRIWGVKIYSTVRTISPEFVRSSVNAAAPSAVRLVSVTTLPAVAGWSA
ncbi:MAG: hypothetical protein R6U58_11320 [Bacteroidales bacterium]